MNEYEEVLHIEDIRRSIFNLFFSIHSKASEWPHSMRSAFNALASSLKLDYIRILKILANLDAQRSINNRSSQITCLLWRRRISWRQDLVRQIQESLKASWKRANLSVLQVFFVISLPESTLRSLDEISSSKISSRSGSDSPNRSDEVIHRSEDLLLDSAHISHDRSEWRIHESLDYLVVVYHRSDIHFE